MGCCTLAHYTGGIRGWGTMVYECQDCHEEVAEYETDENGVPTNCIYDESETHRCKDDAEN
jgi:hypothetical protein